MTAVLPGASPYDLEGSIVRDGRPRDVLSQRVRVNDAVRIWTVQAGWSSPREYFVKHILPTWVPIIATQTVIPVTVSFTRDEDVADMRPRGKMIFTYLLVPQLDDVDQTEDTSYLGIDALEIYKETTLLITAQDFIVIEEGMAKDAITVVVADYKMLKIRPGESGVIYSVDNSK